MQKNKQYRLIYELKKFALLHSIRYTDMFAFLTDVLWVLYKMNDLPIALALKGVLKNYEGILKAYSCLRKVFFILLMFRYLNPQNHATQQTGMAIHDLQ